MYNFESLDILWAWIGHPSEMLWRFEFLETLRCSFSSCLIFHGPHTYSRVKSYGHLNFPGPYVFNYNGLDILCAWINIRVKWYNHLNFSRASVVHFRASRYTMGLTHTPESKVMTVWIFGELPITSSRVSIYYEPKLDILVKCFDHLNFSRASIFENLKISWASHIYPSQKLWLFEYYELLSTISSVSIYYAPQSDIRVKCYDHLNFSNASVVHFRASRYIIGLTHTTKSKVTAVWICRELPFSISTVSIYYARKWISEWNVMTISITRELPLFIFERLDISWAFHIHPSQKLWPFEYAESFMFNFLRLDILCARIIDPSEKFWPFEFLDSFHG